jgi:hypothetical protein
MNACDTDPLPDPGFYWAKFPHADGWSILSIDESNRIWDFGYEVPIDPSIVTWGPAIDTPIELKD